MLALMTMAGRRPLPVYRPLCVCLSSSGVEWAIYSELGQTMKIDGSASMNRKNSKRIIFEEGKAEAN